MNALPPKPAMLTALVMSWLLLFGPLYYQLWQTHWQEEASGHVPLIGILLLVLLWFQRSSWLSRESSLNPWSGSLLLLPGLWLAHAGMSNDMPLPAMLAQPLVLAGIAQWLGGWQLVRKLGFILLMLLFTLPLPPYLLYALMAPLKSLLSEWAVGLLHEAGYSIARQGVIIVLDHYQLLLADACSGLHSLISLSALALIYQHLCHYSWHRTLWLLLLILPVTLFCNLLRLLILLLTTHHLGMMPSQSWHPLSGLFTFAISALLLLALTHVAHQCGQRLMDACRRYRRAHP